MCEDLHFDIDGPRVAIAGSGANAIIAAIAMSATVSRGQILVDGHDVGTRTHIAHVGIAPADLHLPPGMSVEQYLLLSFRTLGLSRRDASDAVASSLSSLGLTALASRSTRSLATCECRAVIIAAAMIPGSKTLVAESPLCGLEGAQCQFLVSVLERAAESRCILASVQRYDASTAERDVIAKATNVAILTRAAVLWMGKPSGLIAALPRLALHVDCSSSTAREFIRELEEAGFAPEGQPPHLTVLLSESATTKVLLAVALRCGATVLEMIPLVH